jgi:CheY-like chemotaxis protein
METRFASVPIDELISQGVVPDCASPPPLLLVVDDEPVIADTLSLILERQGFAVFAAYGPQSALEIAAVTPPDILLSDVVMPGMNGIELAMEICKQAPDCGVVLLSGQAATMDLLEKYPEVTGRFTILAKPIHPRELMHELSRLGLSNLPAPVPISAA